MASGKGKDKKKDKDSRKDKKRKRDKDDEDEAHKRQKAEKLVGGSPPHRCCTGHLCNRCHLQQSTHL